MQVDEGHGWRLVVDRSRQPFSVLIGGVDWAVELSDDEALALAAGVERLRSQYAQIADQLLDQEDLDLDWERDNLWVGLTLHQGQWSLRFVLEGAAGRRSVEAGWEARASPALALALEALPRLLAADAAVAPSGERTSAARRWD
ncbi:MAG: DUF1818 family protein [Cyanobacteriota bacterium]